MWLHSWQDIVCQCQAPEQLQITVAEMRLLHSFGESLVGYRYKNRSQTVLKSINITVKLCGLG